MFPFFNFPKSYTLSHNKLVKIVNGTIRVLSLITETISFYSRKTHASNGNNPKRKPAVLDVDPVTVLWIVGAFLLIPLILTGFISQ